MYKQLLIIIIILYYIIILLNFELKGDILLLEIS